jgi:hypothetical protein
MDRLVGLIGLLSILVGMPGAERPRPAAGDPGPGATPPPPPPPWHSVAPNPELGSDHGTHASMTVASYVCDGWTPCTRIDIVHQRKGVGAGLIYTWSRDGGATFRHVAIHYGNVGAYASVAADSSGQVTASYHGRPDDSDNLWVARPAPAGEGNCGAASIWQCTPRGLEGGAPAAMASDGAGHVYVAYKRSTGDGGLRVWHDNPDASIGNPAASGNAVDIALDAIDRVHLAWTGGRCVYYQYWSPSAWSERETVDCAPDDTPPSNPGRVAIKVDRSWHPHLAYTLPLPGGAHRIKHAYKTDAYTWQQEQVAFVPANSLQPGISILLDRENEATAAISYGITSFNGDRLVVARPGSTPPFGGWPTEVADTLGGGYSSLAWVDGRLAVAHRDAANKKLRFSKRDH